MNVIGLIHDKETSIQKHLTVVLKASFCTAYQHTHDKVPNSYSTNPFASLYRKLGMMKVWKL